MGKLQSYAQSLLRIATGFTFSLHGFQKLFGFFGGLGHGARAHFFSLLWAAGVLECFGGAGYVEDTGLPALLRDAQVLSIWEGTTNVLALETLRALVREDAWEPVLELVRSRAGKARDARLVPVARTAVDAAERAISWARETAGSSRPALEAGARRFAFTLGRAMALSLTVEHAEWCLEEEHDRRSLESARRFASRGIDFISGFREDDGMRAVALGERLT